MDAVQHFAEHSNEYWFSVYLPISIWLLIVLTFFVLLLKKYTFGNWTRENPNPYAGETFDMPRGVFRGTLTLTLLYVVVIFEMVNMRIIGLEDEFHEFMVAFQMMIAFYFGSKVMHHITSSEKHKTKIVAENRTQMHTTTHQGSKTSFENDNFSLEDSGVDGGHGDDGGEAQG